ncbi:MAG: NrsF family protein [Paracoccus sp. (in: a-proteobacteria)]
MKTENLIAALAADPTVSQPRPALRIAAGGLVSLLALLAFWHLRPDLARVLSEPLVLAKFLLPLSLATILWTLRPQQPEGAAPLWPALLPALAAAALFLTSLPQQDLGAAILGSSWSTCLFSIPLLALPVGACIFAALRQTVITRPAHAGLIAGLFAGAVAAMIYALHCDEDAPAFYAVWYSAGIAISGLIGRVVGRRVLGV